VKNFLPGYNPVSLARKIAWQGGEIVFSAIKAEGQRLKEYSSLFGSAMIFC
jgi:hypothetical protein